MEELESSVVQAPEQTVPGWYEGVSLEDAELYIHANLKSAARSVIAIGYYLKCVKAKELFAEAGFKDIYDYAKDRFGFSTSTTNRYMSRNDKFSINGNSPILDEKYKDFNKSQLQEMLSLDSEQLEKVTPEMSVLQIREMKKPKEIPYVAIPGQVELTDFPGIEPEDVAAASKAREEAAASQTEKQAYTISAEDLLPDPEPQETEQSIAISQKEPEPEVLHFTAGNRTIDNAYGATIAAVVRAYLDSGYSWPEKECEVTAFGLVYKVLKRQDVTVFYMDTGQTVFDVENTRLEEEYQYWHGTKAEPEPAKQTPAEPEQDSCPPGITDCRRQEWGTGPAEQEAGKKECKACWASWKRQHKALGAAAVEQEPEEPQEPLSAYGTPKRMYPEDSLIAIAGCEGGHSCTSCHVECGIRQKDCYCVDAPMGNPFPCDTLKLVQTLWDEIGSKCQFVDNSLAYHRVGDHEPVPCCRECEEPCEYICGRAKKQLEAKANIPQESNPPEYIVDGEFKEIQESEESLTELQIAQEELERVKKQLNDGLEHGVDENNIHIRRLKTKVCAWASYVCDLDSIVNPPPKPVQPELPVLKNNDQRKAWLRDYKSWGLWYRDENIGVSYYKYDFDNGARLIVEEYQEFSTYTGDYTSFFMHLVGGPKPPMHPSYGYEKWTHSEKYSRTINSDSELFEFLKALQQKKG